MTLQTLIENLITNTRGSLWLFLPELVICATVLLMLLARVFNLGGLLTGFRLALVGSIVALVLAAMQATGRLEGTAQAQEIFTGFLIYDSFTVFFRCILLLFAVLFCVLTAITGIPDREDGPDIYTLVLGATLGMCLMASANHLLMIFLAVEMASVPSYVLAGLFKGKRKSSEAALKYSVYGAGAAGVMLYGISLLAGVLGTCHLPTMAQQLIALDIPGTIEVGGAGMHTIRALALGGLMLSVGLAFKLSAVPFHFWCPDVFEGAPAEVNAFLSVASKAAALALLVRVVIGLGVPPATTALPATAQAQAAGVIAKSTVAKTPAEESKRTIAVRPAALLQAEKESAKEKIAAEEEPAAVDLGEEEAHERATMVPSITPELAALRPVRSYIVQLLALIAVVTCTFGNLAAFGQTNIKRLLAYSTIAHAGYMMMPVAAAIAVVGSSPETARGALAALTFYIALYLFMNLGAFAIVAFLRNASGSEEIDDYAGLIRSEPGITVCFVLILVSLIGLPPMAGFAGKYAIFLTLVSVGGPLMITLLVIAGLNTAISLVYYLRVAKTMTIDPEPDSRPPVVIGFAPGVYASFITAFVVALGIFFDPVYRWAYRAVEHMFL